jgi:hypothetical protein
MANCKISSTPMEKAMKLSAKTDSKAINKPVYKQLVGSLIYLTTTRLDLSYAVSYISWFMLQKQNTGQKAMQWYVKRTLDFGILYGKSKGASIVWVFKLKLKKICG